jgi:hypothetical protein
VARDDDPYAQGWEQGVRQALDQVRRETIESKALKPVEQVKALRAVTAAAMRLKEGA